MADDPQHHSTDRSVSFGPSRIIVAEREIAPGVVVQVIAEPPTEADIARTAELVAKMGAPDA